MDNEQRTTIETATDAPTPSAGPCLRFEMPAGALAALLLIAPKQDVRYYLRGVMVDTTGRVPVAMATDGHRMLVVRLSGLPDDMPRGCFIFPREMLASVKPIKVKRDVLPFELRMVGTECSIRGATTATGTLVDGRVLDWRRVVPEKASGVVSQYNGDYLGDFSQVARLLAGSNAPHAVISHNGDGAAHVNFPANPEAFGVLMPMRTDAPVMIRPDWIG